MAQASSKTLQPLIIAAAVTVVLGGLIVMIPWVPLVAIVFAVIAVLMMLVILIQKPKGGGLSGAFGGSGGSAQAAFGAKTGDMLTGVTVVLFALFLVSAVKITWAINSEADGLPLTSEIVAPESADLPVEGADEHAGHDHDDEATDAVSDAVNTATDAAGQAAADVTEAASEAVDTASSAATDAAGELQPQTPGETDVTVPAAGE